jgi:hypothetical protein
MAKVLPGKVCVSCGRMTSEYTEFKCPSCGEGTITRCRHCREISNTYKCGICKFQGP